MSRTSIPLLLQQIAKLSTELSSLSTGLAASASPPNPLPAAAVSPLSLEVLWGPAPVHADISNEGW